MTVIFNPVSGQGDPELRKRTIETALANHGYACEHLVTTPEKGARAVASEAIKGGADLLAVSGGDGTVVETMAALIGTNIPLAIFPAGTGNLLSINLGLPRDEPTLAQIALSGERRRIDLAKIMVEGEEPRHFAVVAGAGFDAWMIRDADRETKNRLGLGAYLVAALKNLKRRPVMAHIQLDDNPTVIRRRARSVMVANMGHLQGNVDLVPDARPDDGRLDIAILKAETLGDWARIATHALLHRLHDEPGMEFFTARKIQVHLSHGQPIQFDGENKEATYRDFTVEIIPGAVEVMVAAPSPAAQGDGTT